MLFGIRFYPYLYHFHRQFLAAIPRRPRPKINEICENFSMGICRWGHLCDRLHPETPIQPITIPISDTKLDSVRFSNIVALSDTTHVLAIYLQIQADSKIPESASSAVQNCPPIAVVPPITLLSKPLDHIANHITRVVSAPAKVCHDNILS